MEALDLITKIGGGLSGVVTVVLLIIAYKSGLLTFLIKKDQEQAISPEFVKRFTSLDEALQTIAGNHLEHVQKGIDESLALHRKSVQILEEIQKYGIKCNRPQ